MLDEGVARRRPGDQRTRSSRVAAGEVVAPRRCGGDERRHLGGDRIDLLGVGQPVDDQGRITLQHLVDLVDARGGRQVYDAHGETVVNCHTEPGTV